MKRSTVAVIDEPRCIGCTLCIRACPVDAIVGASGMMHTVIEDDCIGCDLCIAPCPVDCITMAPPRQAWTEAHNTAAKRHAKRRKARLAAQIRPAVAGVEQRRAAVAAAIERVRARRAQRGDL